MKFDLLKKHKQIVIYTRTILTSIIIGSVCSAIGVFLQDRSWEKQYKLTLIESDRKMAEEIFSEISKLMDSRIYKTRLLLNAKYQKNNYRLYLKDYKIHLNEWNENLNRNVALIECYFGANVSDYFYNNIHLKLRKVGADIQNYYNINKFTCKKISKELDEINNSICTIDSIMLNLIQKNNIGRYNELNNNNSTYALP